MAGRAPLAVVTVVVAAARLMVSLWFVLVVALANANNVADGAAGKALYPVNERF